MLGDEDKVSENHGFENSAQVSETMKLKRSKCFLNSSFQNQGFVYIYKP